MLKKRGAYPKSGAPWNDGKRSFSTKETVQQKYTPNEQGNKPYKAVATHALAVPQCTLVAGSIDLTTGGEGAKTPMRKLTSERTGSCSSRKENRMSRKSKRTPGIEQAHPFRGMSCIHPHAAGVDIGAIEIVACVPGDENTQIVKAFGN